MDAILVTGGAGFIGSALVRALVARGRRVVTVDALTYAGSLESIADVLEDPAHTFERLDITDRPELRRVFERHRPGAVLHLAAESHVDRSIDGPADFVSTNLVGTFNLLEESRRHWAALRGAARDAFRFLHVSTDEVFGALGGDGRFGEDGPYRPSSPYAATKAGSDHLARAWHRTYGLPVLVTHGSNTYGPWQFPEKLIPVAISSALAGRPVPVYGRGEHVRDWIHVDDHVAGLLQVLDGGAPGEAYGIGGGTELPNLELVTRLLRLLDELAPDEAGPRERLLALVPDRPGHDLRYATDSSKLRALGWQPRVPFELGLRETVRWYLDHPAWRERAPAERLGLGAAQ